MMTVIEVIFYLNKTCVMRGILTQIDDEKVEKTVKKPQQAGENVYKNPSTPPPPLSIALHRKLSESRLYNG